MCSVALVLIYFLTWFEHVLVLFRAVWLFLLRKSSELKQTNQSNTQREALAAAPLHCGSPRPGISTDEFISIKPGFRSRIQWKVLGRSIKEALSAQAATASKAFLAPLSNRFGPHLGSFFMPAAAQLRRREHEPVLRNTQPAKPWLWFKYDSRLRLSRSVWGCTLGLRHKFTAVEAQQEVAFHQSSENETLCRKTNQLVQRTGHHFGQMWGDIRIINEVGSRQSTNQLFRRSNTLKCLDIVYSKTEIMFRVVNKSVLKKMFKWRQQIDDLRGLLMFETQSFYSK